jgi:23S rRNA (uridine2552-2'-O)-methyltransferase
VTVPTRIAVSRLKDRKHRQDGFYRKAKAEQFASRAVYKLEEIDRRFHLLKKGFRVLDLGCWPGSWMQYTAQRVGPVGRVTGVDLKPVDLVLPRWTRTVTGNVNDMDPAVLVDDEVPAYDAVLSDMAPKTSGIRISDVARSFDLYVRALEIAEAVLRPGGHFVGKLFQGGGFDEALRRTKKAFKRVKTLKPRGSRSQSMELYVVAMDRKPRPKANS